ncbi:unnamed protein product, partial [Prorocentrum cordatum]
TPSRRPSCSPGWPRRATATRPSRRLGATRCAGTPCPRWRSWLCWRRARPRAPPTGPRRPRTPRPRSCAESFLWTTGRAATCWPRPPGSRRGPCGSSARRAAAPGATTRRCWWRGCSGAARPRPPPRRPASAAPAPPCSRESSGVGRTPRWRSSPRARGRRGGACAGGSWARRLAAAGRRGAPT